MGKQQEAPVIGKAEMEQIKKEGLRPTVNLKTLAQAAKKLNEQNLISNEDLDKIKEIHKKAVEKHMGEDMFA